MIPELKEILLEHRERQELYRKQFRKSYSKKYADIVVPEGGKNLVALDMIIGRIARHIEESEKK